MDKAATGFRGMTAKIKKLTHTAVINDTAEESGSIHVLRPKPRDFRMLVDFQSPEQRSVAYQGRKLQVYLPKIQTVQEYDLGKQAALLDQFLLLGFGTPGSDLRRSYRIRYLGEESVGAEKASKLELTPLSQEALKQVLKIELWISEAHGQPVQQKIYQPSRDYILITYSGQQFDPKLSEAAVKLNLPKGVKKEYPQK